MFRPFFLEFLDLNQLFGAWSLSTKNLFVGCANKRNQKPRPSKYVTDKHGRLVRDQSLCSCGIVTAGR